MVHIANTTSLRYNIRLATDLSTSSSSSSPLSYLLSGGGGDYRGIYDIGLKGAYMGYIGLLLNAPYKIDSMMEMSLMMMSFV
jgi:hypothetical protein